MHDTAFRIGTLAMKAYADLETASILEIGSQVVNGSLRDGALPTTEYVGIDIEAGEGVDIVARPGEEWPVENERFDLVMATSVFEHDTAFWRTFLQMCRKTKPGGHVYISAPSNGKIHRYPQDYWRFYPDAGVALEELAKSEGIDLRLVESFVAEREADEWNDFCAIFRRGPSSSPLPTKFIWERIACTNALTWQSKEILNARENTEDQVILWREREKAQELAREREAELAAWTIERELLARSAAEGRIAQEQSVALLRESQTSQEQLQSELGSLSQAKEAAEERLADIDRELKLGEHRIADLESNLRQRQEEIFQAWSLVEEERRGKEDLVKEIESHKAETAEFGRKLDEANSWIFQISGDKRKAEQLHSTLETELLKEKQLRESEEVRSKELAKKLKQIVKDREQNDSRQAKRHKKIAQLIERLREREIDVFARETELEIARVRLASADDELANTRRELSMVTRTLDDRERAVRHKEAHLEWLKVVDEEVFRSTRGWRSMLPPRWRRRIQFAALRERGLFDSDAYLERNADVAAAKADPLLHFILYGMKEGRDGGVKIS